MKTILSSRRDHYLAKFTIFLIVVALIAGMVGCLARVFEIKTWYDLDAVRDNLGGIYLLINDLDSTTPGYEELAGPNANGGKGWQPIGTSDNEFTGTFDGQGYGIKDLFIDRPEEDYVGLFGYVGRAGAVQNVGVLNATVTGEEYVGGLVGRSGGVDDNGRIFEGTVSNSYSTGNVTGTNRVGGLLGECTGRVSNSFFAGTVTGEERVGGLVGYNWEGTVSESYSTGSVDCLSGGGGLVGENAGTVSNSYSTGSVDCLSGGGGLVAWNSGTVSNCYSTGNVTVWICALGGEGPCGGVGLVGGNDGTVSNSFWDMQTSGQATSDGGTGKNTTEMQDIDTFTDTETEGLDEPWDIIAIALDQTNDAYIWNIVDGETYPFLSWES